MAKIFVPTYNNGNCVVIQSSDIIRVYSQRPTTNSTINFTDYYYRSNYYSNTGSQQFGSYSIIPSCQTEITTDFYYRYDFDKIMVIFMCIVVLCYYMAFKPITRVMGRWLKL